MATPKTSKTENQVVNTKQDAPAPEVNKEQEKPAEGNEPDAEPEKTSPALIELRAKEESLQDAIFAAGKGKKAMELMMELWEVQKSITNEKANIVKAQRGLEIEAAKNARIALNDAQFPLYVAKVAADEKLLKIPLDARTKEDIDAANAANKAFQDAREVVVNELLAKYPTSSAGKKDGSTAGAKGKTAEVLELIKPMYEQGKTGAEVRAAIKMHGGGGAWTYFNDGTANAAILAYEKENRLNGKQPD